MHLTMKMHLLCQCLQVMTPELLSTPILPQAAMRVHFGVHTVTNTPTQQLVTNLDVRNGRVDSPSSTI